MMRDALIEMDSDVSRLAQSKSIHPSTDSGRTDLLLQALLSEAEGTLIEELGFVRTHSISHRAKGTENRGSAVPLHVKDYPLKFKALLS